MVKSFLPDSLFEEGTEFIEVYLHLGEVHSLNCRIMNNILQYLKPRDHPAKAAINVIDVNDYTQPGCCLGGQERGAEAKLRGEALHQLREMDKRLRGLGRSIPDPWELEKFSSLYKGLLSYTLPDSFIDAAETLQAEAETQIDAWSATSAADQLLELAATLGESSRHTPFLDAKGLPAEPMTLEAYSASVGLNVNEFEVLRRRRETIRRGTSEFVMVSLFDRHHDDKTTYAGPNLNAAVNVAFRKYKVVDEIYAVPETLLRAVSSWNAEIHYPPAEGSSRKVVETAAVFYRDGMNALEAMIAAHNIEA